MGIAYDPDTNRSTTISGTTVAVAALTNTYDPATFAISKSAVGPGPAGPWNFNTVCSLLTDTGVDVPVNLPSAAASFTLSSGQTHTMTVPVGAQCTVTEVGVERPGCVPEPPTSRRAAGGRNRCRASWSFNLPPRIS